MDPLLNVIVSAFVGGFAGFVVNRLSAKADRDARRAQALRLLVLEIQSNLGDLRVSLAEISPDIAEHRSTYWSQLPLDLRLDAATSAVFGGAAALSAAECDLAVAYMRDVRQFNRILERSRSGEAPREKEHSGYRIMQLLEGTGRDRTIGLPGSAEALLTALLSGHPRDLRGLGQTD